MKRIVRMLIHIILIAVVLFLVYRYSDGWILVESSKYDEIITFVVLSSFLYAINISVKKIVSILTLPIKWLTLGLFAIVLNVLFLYVFEYLVNNTVDVGVIIKLGSLLQVILLSFALTIPNLLIRKSK